MVQIICTHVCKWKNETCWNYSRNRTRGGWRRRVEGVNSSMIYLIYCKSSCKCPSVPPPSTTIIVIFKSYQNPETIHRMGENLCQLFNDKELISRICKELKKTKQGWTPVAYTCNPSCLGSWDHEDHSLRPAWASSSGDSISKTIRAKWTGDMVQVVECLLCKYKAQNSNHSPTKKQDKTKLN
jgi:hypothetical protein